MIINRAEMEWRRIVRANITADVYERIKYWEKFLIENGDESKDPRLHSIQILIVSATIITDRKILQQDLF